MLRYRLVSLNIIMLLSVKMTQCYFGEMYTIRITRHNLTRLSEANLSSQFILKVVVSKQSEQQ